MTTSKTKTAADVQADMSAIFDELRAGDIELKLASELANISGKIIKAIQLDFAINVFLGSKPKQKAVLGENV